MNLEELTKYNYNGDEVVIAKDEYAYGGTALVLKSFEPDFGYWENYAVASVFIEGVTEQLPKNAVCIKNYSENEGILEWLISNGIVGQPIGEFQYGYVNISVCEILI